MCFERENSELSLAHYVLDARESRKQNFPFGPWVYVGETKIEAGGTDLGIIKT